MKQHIIIAFLVIIYSLSGNAQVHFQMRQNSLSEALLSLNKQFDLQYSLDASILGDCLVDLEGSYPTLEKALQSLLLQCNLTYQKANGIYLIIAKAPQPDCVFEGRLIDGENGQALGAVVIEYPGGKTMSDANGYFSIKIPEASSRLQFSHVIYQDLDTALYANAMHTVKLNPQPIVLEEVLIKDTLRSAQEDYDVPLIKAMQDGQLSVGFFLNFEEFAANQPSRSYETFPDRRKSQEIDRRARSEFFRFKYKKEDFKAIDSIFAFSDGQTIFINLDPRRFSGSSRFVKARLIGPYAYFTYYQESIGGDPECPDAGERRREVIDLRSGQRSNLNKHFLRPLLANDSILGPEYEKKVFKGTSSEDYFFRYYGLEAKRRKNQPKQP